MLKPHLDKKKTLRNIYIYIYIRDVTRSRGTRSREIRKRTWRYPRQIFCNVYIRAAQLIIKNFACDLDSNNYAILFLNDNDSASHHECHWTVRSRFCSCPCWWIRGSAIITLSMWTLSFIWTVTKHAPLKLHWHSRCETDVKDIQLCIHAAADPERATQTLFSTTHHYFCYRHLNNTSTGIKVYSLCINTSCLQ